MTFIVPPHWGQTIGSKKGTRTEFQRIRNMSPIYQSGPALGGNGPQLLLDHPEGNRHLARLLDLPSMGVGIEAEVTNRDLALVGNMGDNPGDKLQVVHSLRLFSLFPILVADLACPLIPGTLTIIPVWGSGICSDKCGNYG
jgi:hypothetical protein